MLQEVAHHIGHHGHRQVPLPTRQLFVFLSIASRAKRAFLCNYRTDWFRGRQRVARFYVTFW